MSVSAISSSGGFSPVDWQTKAQQIKADFQSLAQALQSGDLKGAQQAFATLQKDSPAKSSTATTSSTSSTNPNDLMNTLSQALQSGNLSAAQQAFAQLQQAAHHGHHRHHGASNATTGGQSGTPASANPPDTASSGAAGSVLNIVT
jgi:outer membrane protein assembly factor BamD (BamD/ComL family)